MLGFAFMDCLQNLDKTTKNDLRKMGEEIIKQAASYITGSEITLDALNGIEKLNDFIELMGTKYPNLKGSMESYYTRGYTIKDTSLLSVSDPNTIYSYNLNTGNNEALDSNYREIDINIPQYRLLGTSVACPVELRVYDSGNRVTGVVNGKVKEEISASIYDNETNNVIILSPNETYRHEVVGKGEGTYGLNITFVEESVTTTFTAIDIPTSTDAIYEYTIDWQALSQGEKGVTVQVDLDGDGAPEQTFTSGDTFTADGKLSVEDLETESEIPQAFNLSQNYPNPFNPATEIGFALPENAYVTLTVFNALGQKVTTIVDERREAGSYRVTWDATGFPSGVYFYRLTAGGFAKTRKMLLMR